MIIEILVIFLIYYLAFLVIITYDVIAKHKPDDLKIESIKIEPDKKDLNSIILTPKVVFLKPHPPKSKANIAQVPNEDLPNLFKENKPLKDEPEMDYYDKEKEKEELPEEDEVIETEEYVEYSTPINEVEPTRPMCMDYMQMEQTITKMVRSTVSISDKNLIEQLEGTELFDQMKIKMTTVNLELARSVLNNI